MSPILEWLVHWVGVCIITGTMLLVLWGTYEAARKGLESISHYTDGLPEIEHNDLKANRIAQFHDYVAKAQEQHHQQTYYRPPAKETVIQAYCVPDPSLKNMVREVRFFEPHLEQREQEHKATLRLNLQA